MWRLLIRLDPTLLTTVLADWLHTRAHQPDPPQQRRYRRVIAVDGKVRGGRAPRRKRARRFQDLVRPLEFGVLPARPLQLRRLIRGRTRSLPVVDLRCRIQRRSVSLVTPSFCATYVIAAHSLSCSGLASPTKRNARARNQPNTYSVVP